MDELTVKGWLVAAKVGDWVTYQTLRPRVFAWLFRCAWTILCDEADAEEAARITEVKAYFNREKYDPAQSGKAWLLRILRNNCFDTIRRRLVRQRVVGNIPERHDVEPGSALTGSTEQAERIVENDPTLWNDLAKCLMKLTPLQRNCLIYTIARSPKPEKADDQIHKNTNRARNNLRKCMRTAGHEFSASGDIVFEAHHERG
jgi:DNA-directed RNA polymerase specialized sigma24 family protein